MKKYNFDGNWNTKIKLPLISKLSSPEIFNPTSHLFWIRTKYEELQNSLVEVKFFDKKNENEYPEENQISAIEYILNNEDEIYNSIYEVVRDIIYPYFEELSGENLHQYYPLKKIEDLPSVLGIRDIGIEYYIDKKIGWTTFNFSFMGDQEHGLSLLFEGKKFLKHDSVYEMVYDGLISKDQFDSYINELNKQMPLKLYYPNPEKKYFKPWQLLKSKEYLLQLLFEKKYEEFRKLISRKDFDLNLKFPELDYPLIEEVIKIGELEMAKYLYENGAEVKGILHFGNTYYENSKRINFIASIGEDLDDRDENGFTLLDKYLEKIERQLRYQKEPNIELNKKHILLLIEKGATIKMNKINKEILEKMEKF